MHFLLVLFKYLLNLYRMCGDHFCARSKGAVVTKAQSPISKENPPTCYLINCEATYSLSFTVYKAASGGVFLRCGTLSLGYNCTSWPYAKIISTECFRVKRLVPVNSNYFENLGNFIVVYMIGKWKIWTLITFFGNMGSN